MLAQPSLLLLLLTQLVFLLPFASTHPLPSDDNNDRHTPKYPPVTQDPRNGSAIEYGRDPSGKFAEVWPLNDDDLHELKAATSFFKSQQVESEDDDDVQVEDQDDDEDEEDAELVQKQTGNWYVLPTPIGGGGGSGQDQGILNGPIVTIESWTGCCSIVGLRVTHTDGTKNSYGTVGAGAPNDHFTFGDQETITSLSLWGNGAGTRLGAIKWTTNKGNQFFTYMWSWGLKTEYPQDVGQGILAGVYVNSGTEIDQLAVIMVQKVALATIVNTRWDRVSSGMTVAPGAVQVRGPHTVDNRGSSTNLVINSLIETTTKTYSYTFATSFTAGLTFGMKFAVEASVPELGKATNEYTWQMNYAVTSTTTIASSTQTTTQLCNAFNCPAGKLCTVYCFITQVDQTFTYSATARLNLINGGTYSYPIQGVYSAVDSSYTMCDATSNDQCSSSSAPARTSNFLMRFRSGAIGNGANGCPANGHQPSNLNRCVCNSGYWWNGSRCVQGPNNQGAGGCPANGHKEPTLNYRCVCNSGYFWDGVECATGPNNYGDHGCPWHGSLRGSTCVCDSGYFWDGTSCVN
eukprot:c20770_g1_i2.p1 GENE.c20770_g1_i2~~c20770_g1_i2.p1  ORF type:complete len:574 (+),score=102.07 c20770_g1_i2:196-1917(+)